MIPGLCIVIDPRAGQAEADIDAMCQSCGCTTRTLLTRAAGPGWALAAIAPKAGERTAGAAVYHDDRGLIAWTGEMFLPAEWTEGIEERTSQREIARALLGRLRRDGVDALSGLDGAFCGAWYEQEHNRWHVFNDRIGYLPVFWSAAADRLVVGPKAWLTWQASGRPLSISTAGVIDVIRAQNSVHDHTLIKGVHWLVGGHALIHDPHSTRTRMYWEFRHLPEMSGDIDAMADAYVEAARRSLRRHARASAPTHLGVSGGMDSRLILAVSHDIGRVPDCFTTGWPFSDDVRFGRALARVADAEHKFIPLEEDGLVRRLRQLVVATDGLHSAAHMVFGSGMSDYLRSASGNVLLEGMVYGVAGGGCICDDDDLATDKPPHACRWAVNNLHAGGSIEFVNGLLREEYARSSYERWAAQVDERYRDAPGEDPFRRAEYTTQSGRAGRNNVLGALPCRRDVLMRSPLSSPEMERWYASTPPRLRRGKRLHMEVLRRRFPRFARVQRTNYNGLPIAEDRWLQEYCWQKEKLHRIRARLMYPQARRWGMDGQAVRAWGLDLWRRSGALDVLIAPDARIGRWVRPDRLKALWQESLTDPSKGTCVLTLATIELMIRHLEQLPQLVPAGVGQSHKTGPPVSLANA